MENGTLLAAVDMGSNSFRLEIGRFESGHISRVEYLKETVRQGSGLDENKHLTPDAMERGWDCLARFGERLHGFQRQQVRAVATQTLREAKNRDVFLQHAERLLGFPIDVISGHEEARLIFQGVTHALPQADERRLVVDIGGRSTEIILGQGYTPHKMESYRLGSVAWSSQYFPNGELTAAAFNRAKIAALALLDEALPLFPVGSWDTAYGSSGTAGALADALSANGWPAGEITLEGLNWLVNKLIKAGHANEIAMDGMKDDRRAVIGGGISVMLAVFELFELTKMQRAQAALRHGALYDLIDREHDATDVRQRTVNWLADRYSIDEAQAQRVATVAHDLFEQIATNDPFNGRHSQKLQWAARLHEIGAHISHSDAHRHGAYILDHVDAPGFSLPELHRMSQLVLGQRGKLKKLSESLQNELFIKQLMCLRLAVLLCHARKLPDHKALRLQYKALGFKLVSTPGWAQRYPQSAWLLNEEMAHWQKVDGRLTLDLR